MKSMEHVLAFRPARLPRGTAADSTEHHPETTSRHPGTDSYRSFHAPGTSQARRREALTADRELRRLAGTLIPRELRTVVRSIGAWEDLRVGDQRSCLEHAPRQGM